MDLLRWSAAFPGLMWVVEHRRSRIKLLNDWKAAALGADTERLLKDAGFRKQVIRKSDLPLLIEFWEMITSRQPAVVSFHLNCDTNTSYLLQGWPDPNNSDLYFGVLMDGVHPAAFLSNGAAATCQLALGKSQYPVLVLNVSRQEIVASNDAAKDLFGGISHGWEELLAENIAPGELRNPLFEAASQALREDIWAGTLLLRSGAGNILGSKVRISPCSAGGDTVRIALLNIPEVPPVCEPEPQNDVGDDVFSLQEELEALLADCPGVDGLMFSDIQSAVGRVEVYGVGKIFSSLAWGASHAYEGTIAQDIERFGLDSLTVEDTLDSIKSIDWVMFIPCGVRSYFAKPFYSAEGLHAVLIFASETPGSALNEESLRHIFERFARSVARWRQLKH